MSRLPYLDGIRGMAILLVLFYHYVPCQIFTTDAAWLVRLKYSSEIAITGVDLFFVLSGFLIAGILRRNREASNYFAVFYIRRFARIVPIYLVLLAAFVLLPKGNAWLFDGGIPLWSYATFTQNIYMGTTGTTGAHFLGITWSLAVEEQFYLLMPLLIYALNWRWSVFACVVGAVTAIGLRHAFPGFHGYVNMPFRMDALLYGALLALLHERGMLPARLLAVGAAAGVAFIAAIAGGLRVSDEARHTIIAIVYASFLGCAITCRPIQSLLSARLLVWFGTLAYGIYIFHEAVSGFVHGGEPRLGWGTLVATGITLGISALCFRFIEQPVNNWGHRFRYGISTQRPATLLVSH